MSKSPLSQPGFQRDARMVWRIAKNLPGQVVGTLSGSDYSQNVMTQVGRASFEALTRLGEATAQHGPWQVAGVDMEPPRVAFGWGEQRLEVALESRNTPHAFLRTREFSVTYRGKQSIDEEGGRLIHALGEELERFEADAAWLKAIRRPLLRRVSYFPTSSRIEFRPNLACNHQCPFCNSVDRTGTDNVAGGVDDLLSEMDLWKSLPVSFVVISGGEPTLVKRLPELVEQFAGDGFHVELQTNGMALDDLDYARTLRAAGVRRVLISLHSHDPEVSDRRITFFPGGWARTIQGIENALSLGIRVSLSHVLHGENIRGFAEFSEFIHRRFGRRVTVRLAFVAPTGQARRAELLPSLPEVLPAIREGLGVAKRLRLRMRMVDYCGIPPCLLVPYESMTDVAHLWGEHKYSDDHIQIESCKGCKYEKQCPGIRTYYYETHGDPGLRRL